MALPPLSPGAAAAAGPGTPLGEPLRTQREYFVIVLRIDYWWEADVGKNTAGERLWQLSRTETIMAGARGER